MNNKLHDATLLINKVVQGHDLTFEEAHKAFLDIFTYDTEGYHLIAFIAAIHTKGETADELLGLITSTKDLGIKIRPNVPSDQITDLSGTGGSKIKTINVSTAASFIVAAAGYIVAKQAGFAQTSPTGSGDIFFLLGIDTFSLSKRQVETTLEKIGICPLFISAMSPKLKNRSVVARKVFSEKGVGIDSSFHVATFAYSPTLLNKRIYGCFDEKYLDILSHLFTKLGNERTLILHGVGGIPEASVVGKTIVVEQIGSASKRYELTPNDFGLKTYDVDDIRTGGKDQNMIDFFRILYGKETGAKRDMVLANASAALYVMGKVKDFSEGTSLARQILDNGAAYEKIKELVSRIGDTTTFEKWKKKASL